MITPRSVKNVKTKFTLLHKITYVSLRFGQSAMFASDRKVQCTEYIQAGSGIKLSFFLPVIWYVVLVPFFLPVLSCYNLFFTQLKQFECRTKQENCNVTITIILVKFAYTFIYLFFFPISLYYHIRLFCSSSRMFRNVSCSGVVWTEEGISNRMKETERFHQNKFNWEIQRLCGSC